MTDDTEVKTPALTNDQRVLMRGASYLLPDPGGEVVRSLLDELGRRDKELERLRQQLAELLGALTSDTLNKMMGMIEDVGDDEMWGLAQIWMDQRDAAIRNAQQEQNQ